MKILVVDDEPDIRMLVRMVLERAGHAVIEAANGNEALTALETSHPDLMLLDMRMPGLDGWAVLERMRAENWFARIPVVVLSAHVDAAASRKALQEGCSGYIGKPFRPQELVETVEKVLAER